MLSYRPPVEVAGNLRWLVRGQMSRYDTDPS